MWSINEANVSLSLSFFSLQRVKDRLVPTGPEQIHVGLHGTSQHCFVQQREMHGMQIHYACAPRSLLGTDEGARTVMSPNKKLIQSSPKTLVYFRQKIMLKFCICHSNQQLNFFQGISTQFLHFISQKKKKKKENIQHFLEIFTRDEFLNELTSLPPEKNIIQFIQKKEKKRTTYES